MKTIDQAGALDALWTNGAMVLRLTGEMDRLGNRDCYAYSANDNCRYFGRLNPRTHAALAQPAAPMTEAEQQKEATDGRR